MEELVRQLIDCINQLEPDGHIAAAMAERAGMPPKGFYTVRETAKYLGIGEETIRTEIRAGRLHPAQPRHLTKTKYISIVEVDRWMRDNDADE